MCKLGRVTLSILCLTISLLSACAPTPYPTLTPTATRPPPETLSADSSFTLPASLYFLRQGQAWRLSQDGLTLQQITHEAAPITDLDVSPVDSALVYLSGNQLILTDAQGEQRRVLLAGPSLPTIEDELASLNDKSHITGKITSPRWATDGRRIAYIQNGLNLITISGGQVQTIYPNSNIPQQINPDDLGPSMFMSVIAWSPDGLHLLVEMYRYPLSSLYNRFVAIYHFSDISMETLGCAFCHFAWTTDSQHLFTANPLWGGQNAFGRYDVATGRQSLMGQEVPARSAWFYAHPHSPNADEVYVFMAVGSEPSDVPQAFKLHRVGADGGGIKALRVDNWPIQTALWAGDSRGVLIVTASVLNGVAVDTLVWLPVDEGPAIVLPVTSARALRWGSDT